ncbi:MAG: 3-phosphoshikimate 1-carboxyvinyltransferase, partial [Acidobacteriota bacterium]|nr:3-phosphoshikimate 1-carboxyvinyltransferase [Acidobacteriota bacterium]
SKSISNRFLNLALLFPGETRIRRLLEAEDTEAFLEAIRLLGRRVVIGSDEQSNRGATEVHVGAPVEPVFPSSRTEISCGASGTMLRFMLATLATEPGRWRLDGTERLRERPVGPLLEALRSLGAEIRCLGTKGFAPLEIAGRELSGGTVNLDSADSSQYASALLMAGTRGKIPLEIDLPGLVSSPYLDLTVQAIEDFGGRADRGDGEGHSKCRVEPGMSNRGGAHRDVRVAGDFSSAAYFAAGATLASGRVELHGLRRDSRQGDRRFLDVLEEMGATTGWRDGPPNGSDAAEILEVESGGPLLALERDMSALPDQVPTLAALAPFAKGTTRITRVAHLRLKESDRLTGMAVALRRAGAEVIEEPDGLVIPGVWAEQAPPTTDVTLDPRDDHRLAMSFAVLGLGRPGITVSEPEAVGKSYPGFWEDFEGVFGP